MGPGGLSPNLAMHDTDISISVISYQTVAERFGQNINTLVSVKYPVNQQTV